MKTQNENLKECTSVCWLFIKIKKSKIAGVAENNSKFLIQNS